MKNFAETGLEGKMGGQSRYQLRKAAGLYWLIDMEQGREKTAFNETGAFIWQQYGRLGSKQAVAEEISREFGVPPGEALEDVSRFLSQLKQAGI